MLRKFERYLNVSGTAIRLESPTLVTINSGLIEYRKPSALGDRHRCDAPSVSIDVANEQTFPFGSLPIWERRIFRTWCVDGEALSLPANNSCQGQSGNECNGYHTENCVACHGL
jgi:hypothetical protein